jgi:GDSL-like lipase/acylhydrolase family protein
VRGCRARHVRGEQLSAALALGPDLATVVVGMNDVLRHDFDLARTVDNIEATVASLLDTGCTVATMTFPDIARMLPVMGWLRPRELRLNERIVDLAERYDLPLLDVFPLAMCGDPRMWSHDRIHGSAEGHRRIADGMAELFELPGSDHTWAAPPIAADHGLLGAADTVRRDAWWAATFMVPWLARQVLRRGAGTLGPKRPDLTPVD